MMPASQSLSLPLPLDPTTPDIRAALRERLLKLPYASFLRCVADLLGKMGYSDVSLSSRKDWRGRNGKDGSGGFDLIARLSVGGVARRIAVQAKQFDETQRVYLAHVDALRGVCLRSGATEGVLITSGSVSPRIPRPLLAGSALAPIRVIDGDELFDLLIRHRIGVWVESGTEESRYGLDDAYFASLANGRKGNSRTDRITPAVVTGSNRQSIAPASSEFLVTVAVQPVARRITANAESPHQGAKSAHSRTE